MSFVPFENPIGFGASDFIEIAWCAVLVALALTWRAWTGPLASRLARRTGLCMMLLAAAPVALRLLLLPHHPAPTPDIYDEFGHLLVADTLLHGRLSNPAHPLHRFFETFFVFQTPTYSSIYPIGQGLALAIGRAMFLHPWAGVLLSTAAFSALCYWMLLAWVPAEWALAGGILAVIEFGPLSEWMNSYWGGAFAAAAGCLVFGALPRLKAKGRARDGVFLGIGLGLHLLIRPYESIVLLMSVALYLLPLSRHRALLKPLAIGALAAMPAVGITLLQNKSVTGKWTELPYTLSQYQYGVPAALTFLPNPAPHVELTREQQLEYRAQAAFREPGGETLKSYLLRLEYRVRYYRFFFLVPLYLALPFFLLRLGEWRYAWVALTLLLFALGINFFPAFQTHYLAAVSCLFVLVSVAGLERMSRWNADAALLVLGLCAAQFVFWYSLHIFDVRDFSRALRPYETWSGLNHANPARRIEVNRQVQRISGKMLIFVRYSSRHIFQDEWVYNAADIDNARVVWARDLGAAENEKLIAYYPGRSVWLLEPDVETPALQPYPP